MPDDLEWNGNLDANAQFFVQFALQTFLQAFSLLPLSTGELPKTGEMHAGPAFRDKIAAVATDQAGGYFDDFRHAVLLRPTRALNGKVLQIGVIGHAWHDGALAVQQVAPKSIRAWLKS